MSLLHEYELPRDITALWQQRGAALPPLQLQEGANVAAKAMLDDIISDVVKTNMAVEITDLDHIPFSDLGGSQRFATDFNITTREEALQLLDELNTELIA